MLVSILRVLSDWLAPSGMARRKTYMARPMVRRNINGASRYHETVMAYNLLENIS